MKEKLHNMPLWVINLITVVSGIITIITPIATLIASMQVSIPPAWYSILTIIVLIGFILILFLRVRKYRSIAINRMEIASGNYQKLMNDALKQFFSIMHSHKKKTLTVSELTNTYMAKLSTILDNLCEVLSSFTQRKISACIKLITYNDAEEIINIDNASLVTFCRSNNSESGRQNYEHRNKEILLKDNTDFREIISNDNDKDYFYQGDLEGYDKLLKKTGQRYDNTHKDWYNYYAGTIVVPIRVEFKLLYHQNKDDEYHILGFVCVDSKSKDAFTEPYEKYNVDVVKAYADLIYILLGQYRHYLKKLTTQTQTTP